MLKINNLEFLKEGGKKMAEINKDYKCNICGNVVKVIQAGIGTLSCCGQPMELIAETTQTAEPEIAAAPGPVAAPEIKIEEMPPVPEATTEEIKPEPVL